MLGPRTPYEFIGVSNVIVKNNMSSHRDFDQHRQKDEQTIEDELRCIDEWSRINEWSRAWLKLCFGILNGTGVGSPTCAKFESWLAKVPNGPGVGGGAVFLKKGTLSKCTCAENASVHSD